MTSLLTPYKYASLDLLPLPPCLSNNGLKYYLTLPQRHWYRVYELPRMQITLDSVVFDGKVRAVAQSSNDPHVFVAVRRTIYVMNQHSFIRKFELEYAGTGKISVLHLLYPCLVAAIDNYLFLGVCDGEVFQQMPLKWSVVAIVHPPTYLNKVVVMTTKEILILNVITQKVLSSITIDELMRRNKLPCGEDDSFKGIETSPALDIVALTICKPDNNLILLFNLQTLEVIQRYELKGTVRSVGFNSHGKVPLIGIAMENGLELIDLNKKMVVSSYKREYTIDWIQFVPNTQTIFIGSADQNIIQELSYDPDQPNQVVVRERQGFYGNIEQLKFIGHEDDLLNSVNVVGYSNSSVAEIRWISLINENMSQKFSLKTNNKQNNVFVFNYSQAKKYQNATELNDVHLSQVTQLAFSINRENDWSNVLTCHKDDRKPYFWNSQNKSMNKIKAQIHSSAIEKTSFQNGHIITSFVTNCGNYALLSLSDLRIVKITMQSGSHVNTFKLNEQSNHIYVDQQNQFLVSASETKIYFMDFYSGKLFKVKDTESRVLSIQGSKTSTLLLTALENTQIIVWDYSQFSIVRRLVGGCALINSMQFTYDNQFAVASFTNSQVLIWNLITGSLVQRLSLNKPISSIDISCDGSVVAATFGGSRSIALFNCKLSNPYSVSIAHDETIRFSTDVTLRPSDTRAQIYGSMGKMEEEEQDTNALDLQLIPTHDDQIISFTVLENGRWVPILHLDQIRERNRVKIAQDDIKIPFFMDFRNIDQQKQLLLSEIKDKVRERTTLKNKEKDKYLQELQNEFEVLLNKNNGDELFKYFKNINPSQYDYELRSGFLGKPQNISKMLQMFVQIFKTTGELDLKITYLHRFLEIAFDDDTLEYDEEIKNNINLIKSSVKENWQKIEEVKDYVEVIVDYLRINTR